LAGAREPDELDVLLREVNPPARFKDLRPNFSVRRTVFRWIKFERSTGTTSNVVQEMSAIYDGDRMIGYLQPFGSGLRSDVRKDQIAAVRLFSMHPGHRARVDPENWSCAAEFKTYGQDVGEALELADYGEVFDETCTVVRGGGETITFVRTDLYKADGVVTGRVGRCVHTAVLRTDAQLGYVVDHSMDWRCNRLPMRSDRNTGSRQPQDFGGGSFWGWGAVNPWPGEGTYRQTFFTAGATETLRQSGEKATTVPARYGVFWNNGPSVEGIRSCSRGLWLRRQGLVGYLGGLFDDWGAATTTVSPEDCRLGVCPAWLHIGTGRVRHPSEPDKDGFYRVSFRRRMTGLPPEIQNVIRAQSKTLFEDRKCLAIRLDGEDFEDQPLPFAAAHRGVHFADYNYPNNSRNVKLSEDRAHSGRRSIVAAGMTEAQLRGVNIHCEHPPICLEPNRRYRLECWILVEGKGTEAFCIAGDDIGKINRGAEHTAAADFAGKDGIGKVRTASVTANGDWRRVEMEFRAPAYGGNLALGFVALGPGKAYFDDFKIVKLHKEGR
jgi:hypothetical protein